MAYSSLFDIRDVEVRGTSRWSAEEVLEAAQVPRSVPLIHADTDEVAKRVEALLLVADARVRRQWPDTVRIDVTERTTAAVVADGSGAYALLDATGGASHRPRAARSSHSRRGDRDGAGGGFRDRHGGLTVPGRCLPSSPRAPRNPREHAGLGTVRLDDGVVVEWGGAEESARKAAVLTS